MAVWKKVIVSGSNAELLAVTASQGIVVGASSSFAGYNRIGTNQSNTVLSGSFTGSFVGDGAGLTGLVSTLGITGSDSSTGTVSLKTQNLTITGASNEIDTTVSGQTVTIGLVNNPVITGDITIGGNTISSSTATAIELNGSDVEVRGDLTVTGNDIKSSAGNSVFTLSGANATANGNLTVTGDLRVNGDLTYLNVANLAVEDKFSLLGSGSTTPGDGGLVVDFGGGSGSVFAYDSATSRWGLTGSFNASGSAYTPDAYVASVVTSDIAAYQQVGNIRVESGEIYIYV